jgi:hypothetical protein
MYEEFFLLILLVHRSFVVMRLKFINVEILRTCVLHRVSHWLSVWVFELPNQVINPKKVYQGCVAHHPRQHHAGHPFAECCKRQEVRLSEHGPTFVMQSPTVYLSTGLKQVYPLHGSSLPDQWSMPNLGHILSTLMSPHHTGCSTKPWH